MPTFLFTDIEGSTRLWQKYPADMGHVIAHHDAVLKCLVEQYGGRVIKSTGDGLFASFEQGDPLLCILEIQKSMALEDWGPVGELRIRAALHAGEALKHGEDYFGLEVNRTARLLSAAWGGQILLTRELTRAVAAPSGGSYQDLGLHLLKDLSEPQHIFALHHPDLPLQVFPPPRTLSAHPHNLPPQPTPFVGRGDELNGIALRLNTPSCRLLTLIGPGGIGKTRLALQAAAAQIENFPHGVFFVPLAPLASGDLIVFAIAEALKFTFYRRDQPKTQLLNYLHEKTVLLVMDNFEHLTETAGLIAEILAAAPQVKVLATSRERLNLRDEELFPVEGMRFPEANDNQGLDEFSAVKLFLQSARRTQPDFELVAQDRPCVARICRLVQGTPLGLELAAGWVRSLSCQEIANEIEASLDFLETNLRDLPDRHRSLRAVFDYSWVLLPENERFLLMQLAVFQGPFDRAGVEAVVRLPPAPRPARLLPLLTGLVDKSLLHRNVNGTYDLHSLVRHYALEHLETDPADTLRTRLLHATHFLTLLQQQETSLQGPDQPKALALLTTCLDDIRAAWLWALSHGHWLLADGALESLYLFHNIKNREDAAARLFSESRALLARRQDPTSAVLTLRLDVRFLLVSAALSRFETVRALLSPCLDTANRLGLQAEIARISVAEGKIYWMEGDYPKSMAHEQKALALYRQLKAPVEVALCLDRLGTLAWSMGDYASALQLFEESLDMLRPVGAPTYIARLYDHLGVVARDRGDLKAAQGYFQESQQIIAGLDVPGQQAFMLNHLGGVLYLSGQAKEAASLYEQSIALSREVGDQRALAYNLFDLANVVFDELSDTSRAEGLFAESLALFETLKEPFGIIVTRISMANAAIVMNNKKAGLEMLQKSLQESLAIQNSRLTIEALQAYAQYFYQVQKIGEGLALVSFIMNMPNMEGEGNLPPRLVSFLDSARSQMSPEEFETHMARGRAYQIEALCAYLAQETGE